MAKNIIQGFLQNMKVFAANFMNVYIPIKSNKVKNSPNYCENNVNLSSQTEVAGKSQVNFTALKKFEIIENDRKFLNVIAGNLRLTPEKKDKLYKLTEAFMVDHEYKNLDDMVVGEVIKNYQNTREFVEMICDKLKLSKFDDNIISAELFIRLYRSDPNNYNPTVNRYVKDGEQFNEVMSSYNLPKNMQAYIFSLMEEKAKENNFNSIFDLFTVPRPDKDLLDRMQAYLGKKDFPDICLDFYEIGTLGQRKAVILNKQEFCRKIVNDGIAKAIAEKFGLDMEDEKLLKLINLRKEKGVSHMQIAFNIADEYSLPVKAEYSIIEIIEEKERFGREYLESIKYQ